MESLYPRIKLLPHWFSLPIAAAALESCFHELMNCAKMMQQSVLINMEIPPKKLDGPKN